MFLPNFISFVNTCRPFINVHYSKKKSFKMIRFGQISVQIHNTILKTEFHLCVCLSSSPWFFATLEDLLTTQS